MPEYLIDADVAHRGQTLLPIAGFTLVPADEDDPTLEYRWSDVPIAARDGYIEPLILGFTRVVRALADDYGQFENQQFGWLKSDYDRGLLDLVEDPSYKYFWNRQCLLSVITPQAWAAGDTPMVIARGVLRHIEITPYRQLQFTAEDVLSTEFSVTYLDEELPRRRITSTIFADCPAGEIDVDGKQLPTIVGLPEPIVYGVVSDADLDATARKGACPGLPVGTETIGGNPSWVRVLLASHACKAIDAVYLGGGLVASGDYDTVGLLVPGTASWASAGFSVDYRDIGGRRYTMIYAIGPTATAILDGSAPLTADLQGIEDVGDGSGDVIENIYDQYQHWLQNWAFGHYLTGAWLSGPTYADASPLIDEDSFADAAVLRNTYTGAGVIGANGDLRTKREWIGAWNASADGRSGWNRAGQYRVTCGEQGTVVMAFTEASDILEGSFRLETRADAMRNVIPYNYRRDWPRNAWTVQGSRVRSQESIDAYRMTKVDQDRNLWFIRDGAIAADIVHHFLHRKMHPPRRVIGETALHGLLADLGDTATIQHADGTPAMQAGPTPFMVERHEVDASAGVTRISGWDYTTLVPFPMTAIFENGAGQSITPYSYGQGSAGTGGGGGGGTTTVLIEGDPSPIFVGGSRESGLPMATSYADAPGYVDQFLDSAKVPGTARFRCHQRTDDAASTVRVRIVAVDASGTPVFTAAETDASGNTDWGHGESGHYQDKPFIPYPGIHPYRIQIKASSALDKLVWVAGAVVVLKP